MILTPFPRPSLRFYSLVGLLIGSSIAFILIVFQPFGTAQFNHPQKNLILLGYGVVSAITVSIYYALSLYIINRRLESRWNILFESLDFFLCLMISMMATYIYYISVFDLRLSMAGMFGFLKIAATVSFLPTLMVFAYIFNEYRGVIRSQLTITKEAKTNIQVVLQGTNKNESITTDLNAIKYIKADDNYVIINLHDGTTQQRHMIRSTLKKILAQLDSDLFYQSHRSYIINKSAVIDIVGNKNSAKVVLNATTKKVPISRTNYDYLKKELEEIGVLSN